VGEQRRWARILKHEKVTLSADVADYADKKENSAYFTLIRVICDICG
jgi:hypothetical protein